MGKVIVLHPTGNTFLRAIATSLANAGKLEAFYTSVASFPGSTLQKLGGIGPLSEIKRREFDPILQPYTHMYPWIELGHVISNKLKFKSLTAHEKGVFSMDNIYQSLDKHVAGQLSKFSKASLSSVYAYEDGALATFEKAKAMNLKRAYDLPIAYWETGRRLMSEEAERLPQWAVTLGGGIQDSPAKLERKVAELQLADAVIVPGNFVKDSLPDWAQNKEVIVSPFGSPVTPSYNAATKQRDPNKPLRVLFAGSMGQRKGLGDLFEAVKMLNTANVELVVMGSLLTDAGFYKNQFSGFTYEKGRPHAQVLELMRTCDVFCLPSIVEGRALVMQEAMSQGLPLIITPNTGGDDLVIEGETGFLVPIRSPELIAEKITWFLENRDKIQHMGLRAQQHAAAYTWEKYASNILPAII
ncbi:glycosyltransferase family 4 protein [Mucilaginibacter aquatilis]|uniref:Glycosyltransferase n=1 Tax=Mucilaginibacter aquatilis TaxID=1517760 RepID=A0A6I4IRF3_9SPHI|nr:glycosyltransferase family 4 protein [Mucilaginibacter aquatilis]MVN92774.1 glycosyltransferase [Mucilaginibacter aquatilis]